MVSILSEPKAEVARKWTKTAQECYLRGCNCQGCFYNTFFTNHQCRMKIVVLALVRKFGRPQNVRSQKNFT